MSRTRIGIFGGTFNPVHNGHVAIAESFLRSDKIDKLWVLLTSFPPHKQSSKFVSYEIRLEMLESAFSDAKNVSISTVEQELPKPNYTIDTVRHLKSKFPEFQFLYCMGEDSLSEFHTWMNYRDLIKQCELLVAKRPGHSHQEVDSEILEQTHFVEHIPVNISSTEIRKKLKQGKNISEEVPEKVLDIIMKEGLYT